ncbi:hypothetical protein BC567DRAFT_82541 [Phyllosticta citribraziliensis]
MPCALWLFLAASVPNQPTDQSTRRKQKTHHHLYVPAGVVGGIQAVRGVDVERGNAHTQRDLIRPGRTGGYRQLHGQQRPASQYQTNSKQQTNSKIDQQEEKEEKRRKCFHHHLLLFVSSLVSSRLDPLRQGGQRSQPRKPLSLIPTFSSSPPPQSLHLRLSDFLFKRDGSPSSQEALQLPFPLFGPIPPLPSPHHTIIIRKEVQK